jgi:hypothetical protein
VVAIAVLAAIPSVVAFVAVAAIAIMLVSPLALPAAFLFLFRGNRAVPAVGDRVPIQDQQMGLGAAQRVGCRHPHRRRLGLRPGGRRTFHATPLQGAHGRQQGQAPGGGMDLKGWRHDGYGKNLPWIHGSPLCPECMAGIGSAYYDRNPAMFQRPISVRPKDLKSMRGVWGNTRGV